MGFNFKKFQNSYKNILFKDAKTRLLQLLSTLIEKEGTKEQLFVKPNYLNQKDIAQLICTIRQTVISLFKELEAEGILNYSQKEISISDISELNKLVQNVK